jgi:hypothetical protein
LLQHRATDSWPLCFQGIWLTGPWLGSSVAPSQADLARLAGRVFVANIEVAIAHDGYPFLEQDY